MNELRSFPVSRKQWNVRKQEWVWLSCLQSKREFRRRKVIDWSLPG